MDSIYYWSAERQYTNVDDILMALEDGEIQGALIDTYVIAEHKESLLSDRIFVKKNTRSAIWLWGCVVRNCKECRTEMQGLHQHENHRYISNYPEYYEDIRSKLIRD